MKDLRAALIATSLLAGAFGSQGQIADRGKDHEVRKTEILSAFDTDGDGRLSAEERDAARSGRRQQQIARFMKDHDLDQSGRISLDELALAGATKTAEMKAKELGKSDEDGDGSTIADEVHAVHEARAADRMMAFHDRIQSDRDELSRSTRPPSRSGPGRRGPRPNGDGERKGPHRDHGDERPIHKLQQRAEARLARLNRNQHGELTAEEDILRQGPGQAHYRSPERGPRWLRAHHDHSNDGPGRCRPDAGAPKEPQSPRRRSHHRRGR